MIIDDSIYISFMCPACGNYFYGSNVRSYNTVGATVFSDGYSRSYYNPFWLTRCPRCNQYFSKKHLFELPESIRVFPESPHLSRQTIEKLENDKLFGRINGYFDESETKKEFIEKAIAQGIYFPIMVSNYERKKHELQLYKDLWHEYNIDRSGVSEDTYDELCKRLLDMISAIRIEDKLTVAELYRNIGDFKKCLATLKAIQPNERYNIFIERIQQEALQKNKMTVTVIENM